MSDRQMTQDSPSPAPTSSRGVDPDARPTTRAVHVGLAPDPTTGAVAPSISLSTTFERTSEGALRGAFGYGRDGHPNRLALEQAVASLEGGEVAACFASGLAAIDAVLRALPAGARVVAPSDVYHGTRQLLVEHHPSLETTFVDQTDLAALRAALAGGAELLMIETPSNPALDVTDILLAVGLAHAAGALCAVDNTWMTPIFQRPIELGADLVIHSSTKYFGGHSDVSGGAVVAAREDEMFARIRAVQTHAGASAAPFDCWLIRRGLQTLDCRLRAQTQTAGEIARHFHGHPRLEAVLYPGLEDHPGHHTSIRQASGFGAMLSLCVRGDRAETTAVAGRCRLFTRATSLGGVESLIEQRVLVEGDDSPTPPNLLRLSIGLEHVDDLVGDLERALGG
ncbi:MAG: PLP-dependent aspartate aminotransferase family protein [Acidobacteriota bacterium]